MEASSNNDLNEILDPIIRQIITLERANYLNNGENARAITKNVQKIIEDNLNRLPDEA